MSQDTTPANSRTADPVTAADIVPDEPATPGLARNGDPKSTVPQKQGEIGGPQGPEPTRFGDWEIGGRCSDF